MSNPGGGSLNLTRSNSSGTAMITVCDYVDDDVRGPWVITIHGDATNVR